MQKTKANRSSLPSTLQGITSLRREATLLITLFRCSNTSSFIELQRSEANASIQEWIRSVLHLAKKNGSLCAFDCGRLPHQRPSSKWASTARMNKISSDDAVTNQATAVLRRHASSSRGQASSAVPALPHPRLCPTGWRYVRHNIRAEPWSALQLNNVPSL